MPALHQELHFETEICDHLAAHGWLYAEGDAARYDRARALFPPDLVTWVQETQPQAWEALVQRHGAAAEAALLDRVRKALDDENTLAVLRFGLNIVGLKQRLTLAQFKPAMGMNPALVARYAANRLRVVRQVRYSEANENCLDLVLFLNGVPVATVELKSDFTQSVQDAVNQYRYDRHPRPAGKTEKLLAFPAGAVVHFAVSNSEAAMTTRLDGPGSRFIPFNRGNDGGAGNPPGDGHPTAYLWEGVWERESWLEILGRYVVVERDRATAALKGFLFPRFHQLDATRKLRAAVLAEGPGGKYLIQHSAGSGKTNSIAWTAHFLADMHDDADQKLFHTVLVVSDRNVLDAQLQEAIFSFERTQGVVATITGEHASKSGELAKALSGGKKIVVCTIQTFPHALKAVQDLAASQGKRFAVIADEAHSSQTGEAAAKLKQVLSPEEAAELADGGEVSTEDLLAAQMASRATPSGITYVAFTATPKGKTLELFGRCPDLTKPAGPGNVPAPFHVYSMQQAIEEGFILDVLQNYTSHRVAFKLAHEGGVLHDQEVEQSAAMKGIMRWVKLHPTNIAQKVMVVVEHFREKVAPLLGGKAKAMIVVGSRQEAVRWQLALQKYIAEQKYAIGSLVAFSGEVNDPESGPAPFTEASKALNPQLKGRDIREAFKGDAYQILLVANKFQTGFDQPLLCGMYVDRRLGGIQAVQTLSRLNRAHPGKDTTYVVDFVNEPAEILAAFKTYHKTATLTDVTDPDLVFKLQAKLDAAGLYDAHEVERVVAVEFNEKAKQSDLVAALTPVADRLLKRFSAAKAARKVAEAQGDAQGAKDAKAVMDALLLAKGDMGAFVRLYAFLSQMIDYGTTDVEKRYLFYKRLIPLLDFGLERDTIDLSKLVLTHHRIKDKGTVALKLGDGATPGIAPMTETGSGGVQDKHKALLSEIVAQLNQIFEGDLTEGDQLSYFTAIRNKVAESPVLRQQAQHNTKEQFANSPDLAAELMNAIMDAYEVHGAMSKQALGSEQVRARLLGVLLGQGKLWEALRADVEAPPSEGRLLTLPLGPHTGSIAAEEAEAWPVEAGDA
jgi:type I restriction enzyme R subunit